MAEGKLRSVSDQELMREAYQALMRGDTKTRDEICAQLMRRIEAREAESVKLAVAASPYFTKQ